MPTLQVSGGSLQWSISHDGARNTLVDIIGVLDSGDIEPTKIIDINKLYVEPGYRLKKLRIDDLEYFVEPGLFVEVLWEVEGEGDDMHCFKVTGKGRASYEKVGGRQNSHDLATGNIMIATSGYKGGRQTFSLQLELVKQFN